MEWPIPLYQTPKNDLLLAKTIPKWFWPNKKSRSPGRLRGQENIAVGWCTRRILKSVVLLVCYSFALVQGLLFCSTPLFCFSWVSVPLDHSTFQWIEFKKSVSKRVISICNLCITGYQMSRCSIFTFTESENGPIMAEINILYLIKMNIKYKISIQYSILFVCYFVCLPHTVFVDNCSQLHTHCRDITADLLKEVCSNVTVDPPLQPLTEVLSMRTSIHGEEARHRCKRFLGRPVWTSIFDVRVFNPSAPNQLVSPVDSYLP